MIDNYLFIQNSPPLMVLFTIFFQMSVNKNQVFLTLLSHDNFN